MFVRTKTERSNLVMNRIKHALHAAPVIFIVMTSTLLGASIFFPSFGNTTTPTKNDNQEMRGTINAKESGNYVQGVQTIQSWWNANWNYRKMVTFIEPGLMSRDRDPCNIYVTFVGNVARNNSIRLTLFTNTSTWIEVPSQIWNATFHTSGLVTYYTSCTVFFYMNMTRGTTGYYYIYYDPNISARANYGIHITIRPRINPSIPVDTHIQPRVYYVANKSYSSPVNSFDVIVNNNTASPQASICLVDTLRGSLGGGANGSDWGGPVDSPVSMLNNGVDTLNITGQQWVSIGEAALDAIGYDTSHNVNNGFSQGYRVNVGPDNPAESWDGKGNVTVLTTGPLIAMVKIHTTDGAFAPVSAYPGSGVPNVNWYKDNLQNVNIISDTVTRGGDGGLGYVTYDILYTFYYYGGQTLMQIPLNFTASPQRGGIGSGYPVTALNYTNTNVYFKNYGDWPHLMQFVVANQNPGDVPLQTVKSWNGTKYGLATQANNYLAKRNDFPTVPWLAWWDNSSKHNPSIGMMAVANPVGWQVLSLAVPGIGANGMLQQILPEGLQGSNYLLSRGSTLKYDYYLLTDSYTNNYTSTANMCQRMNKPVSVQVGNQELFSNNAVFVHVQDHSGQTAFGVQVTLRNSTFLSSQNVNNNGNVTFTPIPDGTYTLQVNFTTGVTTYIANSSTIVLNHAITRYYYIHSPTSIANLTISLRNKAEGNAPISGAQIRILNLTHNNTILQGLTDQFGTPILFRLYSSVAGNTPYIIQVYYGGILRVTNITSNPFPLSGNTVLNLGEAIDTTAITVQTSDVSVNFGATYHLTFTYHESSNVNIKFTPSMVNVSTSYQSLWWRNGIDYTWSANPVTRVISLNLMTGPSVKLNQTKVFPIYIYAFNSTVEQAIQQEFIVVNPIATGIEVFFNGANITASPSANFNYTAIISIRVRYFSTNPMGNLTTLNSTLITMTDGVHTWSNFTFSSPYYTLTLNTSYFNPQSSYSFRITCTTPTTSTQVFALTIFPRSIQTSLKTSMFPGMTPQLGQNPTITANWTDVVTIYVQYHDDLNHKFILTSTTGLYVYALIGTSVVNATSVNGTEWRVAINTKTAPLIVGGTTLIAIRSTAPGVYNLAEFIFNLFTKPIATYVTYTVNGYNQTALTTTAFQLDTPINILATEYTWNGTVVQGAGVTVSFDNATNPAQAPINLIATPLGNWTYMAHIFLDTNTFYAENQFFYLQIQKTNYTSIVQPIIVRLNPIATFVVYTVNGFTQSALSNASFPLGSSLDILATEYMTNGSVVLGPTVWLTYNNAITQAPLRLNATSMGNGSYIMHVSLDTNIFYAQNEFFYLQLQKTNYISILQPITIRVSPIQVTVSIVSNGVDIGDSISRNINDRFNFTISLNATNYNSNFLKGVKDFKVTLNVPYLQQTFNMSTSGNGIYWVMISAPSYASPNYFPITMQIYVPQNQSGIQLQYDIKTTYTFKIYATAPTNQNLLPWVIVLLIGIIAISTWFILYQIRFKYPPIVRKIHDLKRSVSRGRLASRIPTQKVKSREENIFQEYAKQINEYGFLQTRDSRYAARAAGYAPVPDQSISLEFEMPSIDKADREAVESKAPKLPGKAPTKQYVELETPPAPAPAPAIPRPLTKPAPKQPGAKVSPPIKPIKPTGVKPPAKPSIKALPKPAARLPKPAAVPSALPSTMGGAEASKTENLYQDLVLLEQKRYKAERSLRDLDAKHARGVISDEEYGEYNEKIKESLDKLKENIAQLRRKMLSF